MRHGSIGAGQRLGTKAAVIGVGLESCCARKPAHSKPAIDLAINRVREKDVGIGGSYDGAQHVPKFHRAKKAAGF
ncbi:MAG: hypothetical protein JNJ89_08040 [Rubrivivax sp.]|nr:hypothetical protein [Rubrivivax sp.]